MVRCPSVAPAVSNAEIWRTQKIRPFLIRAVIFEQVVAMQASAHSMRASSNKLVPNATTGIRAVGASRDG